MEIVGGDGGGSYVDIGFSSYRGGLTQLPQASASIFALFNRLLRAPSSSYTH